MQSKNSSDSNEFSLKQRIIISLRNHKMSSAYGLANLINVNVKEVEDELERLCLSGEVEYTNQGQHVLFKLAKPKQQKLL